MNKTIAIMAVIAALFIYPFLANATAPWEDGTFNPIWNHPKYDQKEDFERMKERAEQKRIEQEREKRRNRLEKKRSYRY